MAQTVFSADVKVLDLVFRRVSAGRLLQEIKRGYHADKESFLESAEGSAYSRQTFLDFAESSLAGYSEDEQLLLCERIRQAAGAWKRANLFQAPEFLVPVLNLADEILTMDGKYPVCRSGFTLLWRDAYLRLGQDLFVCAYLARRDLEHYIVRNDFDWPLFLRTDDDELYRMLRRGIAENHNHINGGTQSFPITWCNLMNYPERIRTELKHFQRHPANLFPKMTRGQNEKALSMEDELEVACLIRTILYRSLKNGGTGKISGDSEKCFAEEYLMPFSFRNLLRETTDRLRAGYGAQVPIPGGGSFRPDYALTDDLLRNCGNSHRRVVIGERVFLYDAFRACLVKDGFTVFEQKLFYLYLVLKCGFRSEMIQNNGETGFKNFQNYQDRKDDGWDENEYFWEAARIALNMRLSDEPTVSLEGRLVPKPDPGRNIEKVRRFDDAKRFADGTSAPAYGSSVSGFSAGEENPARLRDLPWYYIFHFVKGTDDRKLAERADPAVTRKAWKDEFIRIRRAPCRNFGKRKMAIDAAEGLMEALRLNPYFRTRVHGIDAASDEFQCRPEVFAQAYRYISGEQKIWNAGRNALRPDIPVRIRKTFHAGEDFADLADGMRAVDEAVEFLELDAGSRIGHALAAGVNPEDHYTHKHCEIVTTKQDRLDDLVWLLFRSHELGVIIPPTLHASLRQEANSLFAEIYGDAVRANGWNCGLSEYRKSMHLRADDPSLYQEKRYRAGDWNLRPADRYGIRENEAYLGQYRADPRIAGLYAYYHFGIREGVIGEETYLFSVMPEYMELIRRMQDAMMRFLEEKRITIECNPSSNVLIGTFREYGKHPVFRFNSRKLNPAGAGNRTFVKVCVNTDDLGVFDTSLEFEYALLYAALREKRNAKGRIYSDRDILDYLDDLRKMGLAAVFP